METIIEEIHRITGWRKDFIAQEVTRNQGKYFLTKDIRIWIQIVEGIHDKLKISPPMDETLPGLP